MYAVQYAAESPGVFALGFPTEAEGWEKEGLVYSVLVQVGDSCVRVHRSRGDVLELIVGESGMFHHPLSGLVDTPDPAQGATVVPDADLSIDVQIFQAEFIHTDFQGAATELGVHVLLPQGGRFHDVAVGVDDYS